MSAVKGNGLDAANDQPAKTLTKDAIDFIANHLQSQRLIPLVQESANLAVMFYIVNALLSLIGGAQ
jgi:protein tyrosine phosphatase